MIDRVVRGGYIERVLDEATDRMRIAESATDGLRAGSLDGVFRNLDRYLLERVESARRR